MTRPYTGLVVKRISPREDWGRGVVNFRLIICQTDSIVLNKVSTIAVKIIY